MSHVEQTVESPGQIDLFTYLNSQQLRLIPGMEAVWKEAVSDRLQSVWRRIRQDPATRHAFHGTDDGPDLENGHIKVTVDFDRIVKHALEGLADLDNECDVRSDTVNNRSNLEYLGSWAAANHTLATCRELFRIAEYSRVKWDHEHVNPGYVVGTPFRFKKFNLELYRQQRLRLFKPSNQNAFLVCRVRELGLRVFLNLAHRNDAQVNSSEEPPFDELESWLNRPDLYAPRNANRDGVDVELLKNCNRYYLMAALFELKWENRRDLMDFCEYFGTSVISRLRTLGDGGVRDELPDLFRAAVETLPLGLSPPHTVAVIKNDYGLIVSENKLRELSDWILKFFDLQGVYNLEPALAAAAELLGIAPDRLSILLVSLNRNDDYDPDAMSPFSEGYWNELRRMERDAGQPSGFLQKTITASNVELMAQIQSHADAPTHRHGSRLLKLLLLLAPEFRGGPAELATRLHQGLRRSVTSLAGLNLPQCYPTGLRRNRFIQSCQDVQVAVAERLRADNLKVVALTWDEILLEIDSSRATELCPRVKSLALEAARPLMGSYAGPIDTEILSAW